MKPEERARAAFRWWYCDKPDCDGLPHGRWRNKHARAGQRLRTGLWLIWLLLAGRGYGKTQAGAEAVAAWLVMHAGCRVALVAATFDDGRDTMVEGISGLLATLERYGVKYVWNRSLGQVVLANGSRADLYSSEKPRQLRGPGHHYAWCDELAWWSNLQATWDNLLFSLRAGGKQHRPRIVVTTTPRPLKMLNKLAQRRDVVLTRGRTMDNAENIPEVILEEWLEAYAGTSTGRQELDGVLMDEAEGAKWTRALLEQANAHVMLPARFDRVVVSLDPAVKPRAKADGDSHDSDRMAFVVAARGPAPPGWAPSAGLLADALARGLTREHLMALGHLYVLHSEANRLRVTAAAQRAADLAQLYDADAIVVEDNNGGDWIPAVIELSAPGAPKCHQVHASEGKLTRADHPVALYEQERAHHIGDHSELEDDQVSYTGAPGELSPDLMDALVWAATDLIPPVARRRKRREARLVS